MTTYRIHNSQSGAILGFFSAESASDALDACAREAGYADHAAACRAVGDDGDVVVKEVDLGDLDRQASATFRSRYDDYISEGSEMASALEEARRDACVHIPDGVTCTFDDETLTVKCDRV